jgi:hypothetical protein
MVDLADLREHNRALIEEFRANGRRLGERPLLLLTTVGRRTGERHWYLNLVADPSVRVVTLVRRAT